MSNEPIMSSADDQNTNPNEGDIHNDAEPSYTGIAIGILIILLTFVLIGLYLWSRMLITESEPLAPAPERPTAAENNEPESTNAEADAQIMQALSTSDEITAIEADLESTSLDGLDTDVTAIEAELDAELR